MGQGSQMTQTSDSTTSLQPTIITTNDSVREIYEYGVVHEWLYDRKIGVFTIPSAQREAIDLWCQLAGEGALSSSKDMLDLSLHDFSKLPSNAVLSPYIRGRSQKLAKSTANNQGYVAVVLPNTLAGKVAQIFVKLTIDKTLKRETRIFLDRKAALSWLVEKLHSYEG